MNILNPGSTNALFGESIYVDITDLYYNTTYETTLLEIASHFDSFEVTPEVSGNSVEITSLSHLNTPCYFYVISDEEIAYPFADSLPPEFEIGCEVGSIIEIEHGQWLGVYALDAEDNVLVIGFSQMQILYNE